MLNKSKVFALVGFSFLIIACNQKNTDKPDKETILKGSITVLSDETLTPVVDDQMLIFQDIYGAKVTVVSKSEAEIVNDLLNQKFAVAFMARNLTEKEKKVFAQKKIVPRITPFASDAIALISNKNNKDTLIALQDVIGFMQSKTSKGIKGLVFDNPNSSTVRYLKELAKVTVEPAEGVYSFKTNDEVIKFVAENDGMIGVVGVNWLTQPLPEMNEFIDKVTILSVRGLKDEKYYAPTQNSLAKGLYPLARELYIVNCQGSAGLGMGISSFVAGDIGQRIILKSELLPYKTPGRKIIIRNEIINDKK